LREGLFSPIVEGNFGLFPYQGYDPAVDSREAIGFFRAFFHLVAGMFFALFVPITSLLSGFENHVRPWSLFYFLLLPGAGLGLLATAFGRARWKLYVRITTYALLVFVILIAIRVR
jgi:hypothetical protein